MKWLMALMLAATVAFGGTALAGYQTGIIQPFIGLTCRTLPSAEHIFTTWKAADAEAAREVFTIYQGIDECRFLQTYEAYFVEMLDSIQAENFQGVPQIVLLFAIAPSQGSDRRDYLVTWEPLFPLGDPV